MNEIDINEYSLDFVRKVTSDTSNKVELFIARCRELDQEVNASLLLTAAIGMGDEAGEFSGVVKKCFFHGHELDKKTKEHLVRELGDVLWYWANACRALSVPPEEVIKENMRKLEKRYPGGSFDEFFSKNRNKEDI